MSIKFSQTKLMETAGVLPIKSENPVISTFTRLFVPLNNALTKVLIRFY